MAACRWVHTLRRTHEPRPSALFSHANSHARIAGGGAEEAEAGDQRSHLSNGSGALGGTHATLYLTMYLLISFRKTTPP